MVSKSPFFGKNITFPYAGGFITNVRYVLKHKNRYYGFPSIDEARLFAMESNQSDVPIMTYSNGKVVGVVRESVLYGILWVTPDAKAYRLKMYGERDKYVGRWGEKRYNGEYLR